jgi:hypothetical protein
LKSRNASRKDPATGGFRRESASSTGRWKPAILEVGPPFAIEPAAVVVEPLRQFLAEIVQGPRHVFDTSARMKPRPCGHPAAAFVRRKASQAPTRAGGADGTGNRSNEIASASRLATARSSDSLARAST